MRRGVEDGCRTRFHASDVAVGLSNADYLRVGACDEKGTGERIAFLSYAMQAAFLVYRYLVEKRRRLLTAGIFFWSYTVGGDG